MKNINYVGLLITASYLLSFSPVVKAQNSQNLGKCISEVRKSSSYAISSKDAATSCISTLQYQSPVESLGECISGVRESSSYNISSNDASQLCQSLLARQSQNTTRNDNNGNGSGSTIIVVPQNQSTNPNSSRNAHRQCVHTWFNQVWDDIHCQYNNGMFEWRTVYY